MSDAVKSEVKDGIGLITLNRPEKRNAINGDVLEAMNRSFSDHSQDPQVRAILLQGAGPVFSAGIDFNYLATVARDDGRAAGIRLREGVESIQAVLNRIEKIEKPVVARIHGFCGGLGLELALTADFRIAAETATLGLPEIILGIIPDCGGTTRLTRMVGPARAKELIMTGDMIPARKAYEMGLLNEVVSESMLEERTQALLSKLLQRPLLALGLAKRAIDWGVGMDKMSHMEIEAYIQSLLITNKDFPETLKKGFAQLLKK
ncbi:MAG TPA: enoyl-CoA hydratase/isomerase family protein [Thermodesulfobacteriota bacterium]|nr:enoyl-CoA hydratase/isomerase family protein [Thermodesulfobacteriota bacterium]